MDQFVHKYKNHGENTDISFRLIPFTHTFPEFFDLLLPYKEST